MLGVDCDIESHSWAVITLRFRMFGWELVHYSVQPPSRKSRNLPRPDTRGGDGHMTWRDVNHFIRANVCTCSALFSASANYRCISIKPSKQASKEKGPVRGLVISQGPFAWKMPELGDPFLGDVFHNILLTRLWRTVLGCPLVH